MNKSFAMLGSKTDVNRLDLNNLQPNIAPTHLVEETPCFFQVTSPTYERSRYLQAIIHPLLSRATWAEAVDAARCGERTLLTETRDVSILRLDIVKFTEFIDNHPLDQIIPSLNVYLDQMTQLVYCHNGDVDKYLGDGFLSVFNNADDAVQAGCALQRATANFNRSQSAKGALVFLCRVAIDTGQVFITSLGSHNRQDRIVIGMPVNLAERLQAIATPGRVWLSQATFERLRNQSGCRCLGLVKVKGRREGVVVYEKQ